MTKFMKDFNGEKVYTYEKIIANSNFKAILSKDKQALENRIKELESGDALEN